jgi:type II secretory pathway pseudopilin PulG
MKSVKIHFDQSGVTLVELMIVMVFLAIVMTSGMFFWRMISENYQIALQGTQNVIEVNDSLRKMVNELREARDGEAGSYLLLEANDNEITFFSDVDGDLLTERVRYYIEDQELRRGVVEPEGLPAVYDEGTETVRTIADQVDLQGLPFLTYYNQQWPGDEVNNPLSISNRLVDTRYVEVRLRLAWRDQVGVKPITLVQGVFLRNAKTN